MGTGTDSGSLRAALAAGFAAVLGEPHSASALALWDRQTASGRAYGLIQYVNDVAASLNLPTRQRHELRMALYRALLARGIDPTASVGSGAAAASPHSGAAGGTAHGVAAFRVFRCVVQEVLRGVRADGLGGAGFFADSLARLSAPGLSGGGRQALLKWAAGEDQDGWFQRMASSEYPAVAHLLYVAACDALGPVAADKLFSRAVKAAEALPEAARFPPQRLL